MFLATVGAWIGVDGSEVGVVAVKQMNTLSRVWTKYLTNRGSRSQVWPQGRLSSGAPPLLPYAVPPFPVELLFCAPTLPCTHAWLPAPTVAQFMADYKLQLEELLGCLGSAPC